MRYFGKPLTKNENLMKKMLLLLLLGLCQNIFAQDLPNIEQDDQTIYTYADIDVKPVFTGGMIKFYEYVGNNFNLNTSNVSGKIYLNFIVEVDGSLSNIKVVKNDLGVEMANEAVRVLKNCPKWNSGEKNGKKIRTSFTTPIRIN